MEFLTDLIDNTTVPWITAALLGFLTAISPCPLATNITSIGYISKDITDKRRIFLNGIFYSTGRVITYTCLALIILLGADQLQLSGFFQKYGEKITGPLLLLIGLVMLDLVRIKIPGKQSVSGGFKKRKNWGYNDALLLGLVTALAFCPYSGVLYFGMLIPLSVSSISGLYLPVIFAIATAIPVIITSWLIAYMISAVSNFYNSIRFIELWVRRIAALMFIAIGLYYTIRIYFVKF